MGVFSNTLVTPGTSIFGEPEAQPSVFGGSAFVPSTQPPEGGFGLGAPGSIEDTATSYRGSMLGQVMLARQQDMLAKLGLAPDEDPDQITPETQQAANEAAIARIATANPDAAQELANRMEGAPEDESLWDQVTGLAGDILSPVVSLGAKALDILIRPSQIIPELIVDKEDDPWYEDVGQALSGNSKAHGADVLDKWGVENNLVKGVGGFVFDVLGDPLTYSGFGMLAKGTQAVAAAGGKTVAKGVIAKGLGGGDDALRLADEAANKLVEFTGIHADAAAAQVARSISGVPQDLLTEAATRGNRMTLALQHRAKVSKVADPEDIEFLNKVRRAGGEQGRMAAAALGGARMRFGVPFTRFRMTSPALPFTETLGFGKFNRYFRGLSGMNRLEQLTKNLPDAERMTIMGDFYRLGFRGFTKEYPEMAQRLGGGTLNFGSMFYESSHQMGRVTGYMSNHADDYRMGGMAGLASVHAGLEAKATAKQLMERAMDLRDDSGRTVVHRAAAEKKFRVLRDNPAHKAAHVAYLDSVPPEAYGGKNIEATFSELRAGLDEQKAAGLLEPNEFDEALWEMEANWTAAKEADRVLGPEEKDAVEHLGKLFRQAMFDADVHGVSILDRAVGTDFAGRLGSEQMGQWVRGYRSDLGKLDLVFDEVQGGYIGVTEVTNHSDLGVRGIRGRVQAEGAVGPGDPRAAVRSEVGHMRLKKPAVIRDGKAASEAEDVEAMQAAIRADLEGNQEALRRIYGESDTQFGEPQYIRSMDDEEWAVHLDERVAELTTQRLRENNYDGIVYYNKDDEITEAVAFFDNTTDRVTPAKVLDDTAPVVAGDRGYFPRIFSERWYRTTKGEKEASKFFGQGEFAHEQGRRMTGTFAEDNMTLARENGLTGSAFVDDPLEAFDIYTRRMANAVGQEQLAAAGQTMANVYGKAGIGAVTWTNTWQAQKGFIPPDSINRLDTAARKAYQNLSDSRIKYAERIEREADQLGFDMGDLARAVTGRRPTPGTARGTGAAGLASSTRRLVDEAVGTGQKTERQIQSMRVRKRALESQMKRAQKQGKRVSDDVREELEGLDSELISLERRTDISELVRTPAASKQREAMRRSIERQAGRRLKADKQIRKLERDVQNAQKQVMKIRTRLETLQAKAQPAMVDADVNMTGYTKLSIEGLENVAMHPYMAAEFNSALAGKKLNAMRQNWRRFVMGPWKKWATIYWPGFHARNNMGAWFNNWLGGTTAEDYMDAYRISRALKGDTKYSRGGAASRISTRKLRQMGLENQGIRDWQDVGERIHRMGARSMNSQGFADTEMGIRELNRLHRGKKRGKAFRGAQAAGDVVNKPYVPGSPRFARAAVEVTENFHRQAAVIAGLRASGGSWENARMFTMMRQGDYEDLNDFEQGIKDLVPFYKWMRTNIPYQIHNLLEAPGKQLATVKAADAVFQAQGLDPDETRASMPEWLKETFTIPIPGLKSGDDALTLMSLDLPMADLHQGAADYLSAFLPMIKPFIEANVLHQEIFTGRPLEKEKAIPLAGWMQLPGVREVLDPFVTTDADGNETIADTTAHMMSAIPVFSRFRNWVFADPKAQKGRGAALGSALFGIRFRGHGDEEIVAQDKAFYYDEILPLTNQLRGLGAPLPDADQVSPEVFRFLGFEPPAKEEE